MKAWMLAIMMAMTAAFGWGDIAKAEGQKSRSTLLAQKGKKGKKNKKSKKGAAAPAEAPAEEPAAKTGRGGPPAGIGVLAMLGYESIDLKDADVGLDGFALVAGPMYHIAATPQLGVSAGAAFHYSSMSGTSDILTFTVSPMTLTLYANGNYFFSPDMAFGLGFGYDFFTLGGSAKTEVKTEFGDSSASLDIDDYSRTEVIARFISMSSKTMAIVGEFASVSGDFTLTSDGEKGDAVDFSGMSLRGGVIFFL